MSVAVQYMVDARVAGVMFTLNPVSGDPSSIAIDASYGLGVTVVGGEVTPDSYLFSKVTRELVRSEIGAKEVECVADHEKRRDGEPRRRGGAPRAPLPHARGDRAARRPRPQRRAPLRRAAGPRVGDRSRGSTRSSSSRPGPRPCGRRSGRRSRPRARSRRSRRRSWAAGSSAVSDGPELTPEDVKEILRLRVRR